MTRPLAVMLMLGGCATPQLPVAVYHAPPAGYLVATLPGCPSCRDAAPAINMLSPQRTLLRAEYRERGITAVPTVITLDRQGREIARHTGAEVARIKPPVQMELAP